ncbi:hypothetical protein KHS38_08125 [Mucilaginibacter sp. Bleaf8]|uniref:hypothetical protein n=1 Tax=Mucilaginibacter sp. Bleaf8 TaxID=2834430 RepID=UPI001BCCF9D1|nr:hypothetical protein [Mucilaginibacter sp. Bleaf8]MBS7564371.1 hypothetical protein [Mucilaginibacter sp. Bleaf8]
MINYCKLIISISLCTFACSEIKAQEGVNIVNDGRELRLAGKVHTTSNESNYLINEWSKGSVKMTDGSEYKNLYLMYNVKNNILLFRGDQLQSLEFDKPVKEFTLINEDNNETVNRTFKNGFPAIDGGSAATFYEVLANGNTMLLKRTSKRLEETREAGSLIPTKRWEVIDIYYLSNKDGIVKLKRDKKSVLNALKEKSTETESYLSANKLNTKDDHDLIKLINYYNTL